MDSESVQSWTLINESWGQTGDWGLLTRLINDQCPRAEILAYTEQSHLVSKQTIIHILFSWDLWERESCGEIYYWIGRYFCIIFSLLFHQQDIFEESFVWKSNLGFQISTVSIVQWWWGFRMRSQRLWTANINMRIIESRLKCDKNESSWTFNQRLVSAKRILMFNPQSQL